MVSGSDTRPDSAKDMRTVYFEAVGDEAQHCREIFVIDCDLSHSMGSLGYAARFPKQYLNAGIQEANAVGLAAGLSLRGFIPIVHTFGVFASRRVMDQVYLSCAYAGLNVKIVGADPGVTAEVNGGTHMALEDAGIMRLIPGVTVVEPSDPVMMERVTRLIIHHKGVDYIRMRRKAVKPIYAPGTKFELGKGVVLRDGTDVTIIAAGLMVSEALAAADALALRGFQARVIDMFTLKPLDEALIIDSAGKTGAIVTAENHNVNGCLGSGVAEIVAEHCPVPVERVGVNESFGEVGDLAYLKKRFALTADRLVERCLAAMAAKRP